MNKEEITKEIRNYFELNNNIKIHEIQFNTVYLKVIALHAYIRKEERLKINGLSLQMKKIRKQQNKLQENKRK